MKVTTFELLVVYIILMAVIGYWLPWYITIAYTFVGGYILGGIDKYLREHGG